MSSFNGNMKFTNSSRGLDEAKEGNEEKYNYQAPLSREALSRWDPDNAVRIMIQKERSGTE
ncbi:hypothetical protein HYALB_00003736 [Hymenoscyphus albidus]|uniref:Uncharacterized protein n=1 Tax=Hymenoscyphus albidus TaxID=595503 RepID=A0A9N9LT79_9HELO|nr:hypothetical protein HYALB_00003736 [Hymenoscyphus albidus]